MEKEIRKASPNNLYLITHIENWLEKKAEKGLLLKNYGNNISSFIAIEPQKITYKLIPVIDKNEIALPQSDIDKYSEYGWEYVGTIKNNFHIMRFYGVDSWQDHTSFNEEASRYNYIIKTKKQDFFVQLLIFMIFLILVATFFVKTPSVLITLLSDITVPLYIAILIFSAYSTYVEYRSVKRLTNIKKNLLNEKPAPQYENWTKYLKPDYKYQFIALFICSLVIWQGIGYSKNSWHKNFENIPTTLPYVLLNIVEQSEYYSRYNPVSIGDKEIRSTNSAKRTWSPLAPMQYKLRQMGTVYGETFDGTDKEYTPTSDVIFYQVISPNLSKIFYDNLKSAYTPENAEFIKIDNPNFTEASIIKINDTEHFFGYFNDKIIYLTYNGNKSIEPFSQEIFEAMEYVEF